jgi:peroxin-3
VATSVLPSHPRVRGGLTHWTPLPRPGFTRTLASVWSVCLLDLFLRVQLNLLGSHVYLSAALRDPKENNTHSGGPTSAPGRPALSLAAQHAYLALHSHFIREGTKMLVPTLATHCQAALAECVHPPGIQRPHRLSCR